MDGPTIAYACLVLLMARIFVKWYSDPLRRVPTVGGPSAPLLSYLSAVISRAGRTSSCRKGTRRCDNSGMRYHGSAFKVALPHRWLVVISGLDGVEDIRRRPDSDLSISSASNEQLQRKSMLGIDSHEARWHVDVIKTTFTRSLPSILPDLLDELPSTVQGSIPCASGWTAVNVQPAAQNIIAQLSSHAFVGPPLSSSGAYLDLAIRFSLARMKEANRMKAIPQVLRPIAARIVNKSHSALLEGLAYLEPMVRARRAAMDQFGNDWRDRPNDLLQSYIDEASERNVSDRRVAEKLFLTNFASIHTSSTSMANVLCDLAAFPEFIAPLRAEVEEVIAAEGWTKAAIDKMWKVDSLLRESQRLHTVVPLALTRMTIRDMTLVDGTFVPKGTLIAVASSPAHRDEKLYPDADVFDPFRFSRACEETGVSAAQAFTHTSAKWLAFGHGKHACPGRFFAADELKGLIAYIVLNYDIKADDIDGASGRSARSPAFGSTGTAITSGKIMVRKRKSDSVA
ncbi:cytochrome P450 [Cerioporus squamosus]|nr:cytochrome P450 [Cerioporus squamosus]